MKHLLQGRVLPVVIGAAVVVGGANVASYAADGHAFHLGGHHHEATTTTVTNDGDGPAFRFLTGGTDAPFAVSSKTQVRRLNASRLDGQRVADISHVYRFVLPGDTALPASFQMSNLPAGHYNASFTVAGESTDQTPAICFVSDSTQELAFGNEGYPFVGITLINGSGLVDVKKTGDASLNCFSDGTLSTIEGSGFQNVATFTRVQNVSTGTVTPGTMVPGKRIARQLLNR